MTVLTCGAAPAGSTVRLGQMPPEPASAYTARSPDSHTLHSPVRSLTYSTNDREAPATSWDPRTQRRKPSFALLKISVWKRRLDSKNLIYEVERGSCGTKVKHENHRVGRNRVRILIQPFISFVYLDKSPTASEGQFSQSVKQE